MIKNWLLKTAIKILIKNLKKNIGYYVSWEANIAMAFQDEYYGSKKRNEYLNKYKINKISNNAAKNFLNLLMGDKNERFS